MALKQVKKYYRDVEKLYFDMLENVQELQNDLKNGDCTQEEVDKLLKPTEGLKQNYMMLSYVMFLFYQPSNEKKIPKYLKQEKDLNNFFNQNKIDKEDKLLEYEYDLKKFKEMIKEWREQRNEK